MQDLETGCCWTNGTHSSYYGDAVELCGIKLYSRSNAMPRCASHVDLRCPSEDGTCARTNLFPSYCILLTC